MRASISRRESRGFTLLEIMTALVVILILLTLLVPAYEEVRMRLDKVACSNNLRQLYVGANSYIQDYGRWPQVNPALLESATKNAYYEAWVQDLLPFGVTRASWICPTIQRDLGGPDYTQKENYRTDYVAMPFDSKHVTPFRWSTAPWFVERGNVHGNGNLYIEANGAVVELVKMVPSSQGGGSAPSQ